MSEPWQACPNCLTVQPGHRPVCAECGCRLEWIDEIARLHRALTEGKNPAWKPELHLQVQWDGGETTVVRREAGAFHLDLGTEGRLDCELDASMHQLRLAHGDTTRVLELPDRTRLGGLQVRAWLKATLVGEAAFPAITDFKRGPIVLKGTAWTSFGKTDGNQVQLAHPAVAGEHCLIARQREGGGPDSRTQYLVVDLGAPGGTFVNRHRVLCAWLAGDDLLQVGPFAWVFHSSGNMLVPVDHVEGVSLRLEHLGVGQRLHGINCEVPAGQFVAVVGESGTGKSTLLKAIVGARGFRDCGTVWADGWDTDEHDAWFRSVLGYVPQDFSIHADLRNGEVLEYAARLRGKPSSREHVETVLAQVALPADCRARVPGHLSGGERKRLQLAAELVGEPRLLLLDEPTSGLDPRREQSLLKLLRNLSYRGCTVAAVTHSQGRLEDFDRVLEIVEGKIVFDGPPEEFTRRARSQGPDGSHGGRSAGRPLEAERPPRLVRAGAPLAAEGPQPPAAMPFPGGRLGPLWQFLLLFCREGTRLANRLPRCLLPLIPVPLFFACSLDLAVPPEKIELLGFLCLLSVIWLSASLSLLAITDEREVVDHERLLYLRTWPYLAAKTVVYWILSALQTAWFFLPLIAMRSLGRSPAGTLYGWPWALFCLILVGWAAVGVGLLLSSLVGRNRLLATAILPLLMMVQIVFSAEVVGDGQSLASAYRHLHLRRCQGTIREADGTKPCPLHAETFETFDAAQPALWLCQRCASELDKLPPGQEPAHVARAPEVDEQETQAVKRPIASTILATYLTISRYGDIALRSFAYRESDHRAAPGSEACRHKYSTWYWEAVGALALLAIGLPAMAGGILMLQTRAARNRAKRNVSPPTHGFKKFRLQPEVPSQSRPLGP